MFNILIIVALSAVLAGQVYITTKDNITIMPQFYY